MPLTKYPGEVGIDYVKRLNGAMNEVAGNSEYNNTVIMHSE